MAKGKPSLFHPKKTQKKPQPPPSSSSASLTPSAGSPSRPTPTATTTTATLDDDIKIPDGPFSEFKLMSSALNGWKYDVFKFDTRKPVDISTWPTPVKLNRKELRRAEDTTTVKPVVPVSPMIGADGLPVVDTYGRQVMLDKDGKPIRIGADGLPIAPKPQDPNTNNKGKGRFGRKNAKKVKQVHKTSEEVRQMKREERYPWVIEDATKTEVWVASMEEVSKADMFAFFMPAANDAFKFVPAHRWYKFQKRFNHYLPTLEEAERVMDQIKKNKDPQTWLLRKRNGQAPSAATSAIFKAEAEGRGFSGGGGLVFDTGGPSLGPGGRRLRAVDSGANLFGDDDADVKKEDNGAEGDLDEVTYEEEFADDEEKMDLDDKEDEEAKELEERLKREYKNANRERNESDDEEEAQLTKEGKKMKKIIRNLDKSNTYDSDEEENPYASSVEESEEEEEIPTMTQAQSAAAAQESQQAAQAQKTPEGSAPSKPNSRAGSAVPPSQTMGGHSIVAKRATSPKAPKPKQSNGFSRASSPLAGSRASSPVGSDSRATGPAGVNGSSGKLLSNKRKAPDELGSPTISNGPASGGLKPHKKRKAMPGPGPAGELDEKLVIEWLSNTLNASTRDCIQHFSSYLTDEGKKAKFTALVKEVAQLKGGILVLKNAYKAGSPPALSPISVS